MRLTEFHHAEVPLERIISKAARAGAADRITPTDTPEFGLEENPELIPHIDEGVTPAFLHTFRRSPSNNEVG